MATVEMVAVGSPAPAGFKAVDFHIHTRFSRCYVDHVQPERKLQTTTDAILEAAATARLDAIAVTDHNSAESVDAIRQLARGSGIWVFPGAEISARGGHCLAIFDFDDSRPTSSTFSSQSRPSSP